MSDASPIYDFTEGTLPLLISIPHLGHHIPDEQLAGMTPVAALRQDADWHLDRLYGFAQTMGASMLRARVSRYVIDLNRPPDGQSLYPGRTTTGLCPTETFRGEPLYPPGGEPDAAEQARRLQTYWTPYHAKLADELQRLKARHGAVLLWEAHSIASVLPRLFDGRLTDLNFGTADGRACDPSIIEPVIALAAASDFTQVLNERFKGGYITRQYGAPQDGVHAIQLEMSQLLYMNEDAPFDYRPERASRVQPLLARMIEAALGRLAGVGRG